MEGQYPEAVSALGANAMNRFLCFRGGLSLITFFEATTFNVGFNITAFGWASEHLVEGREDRLDRLLGEVSYFQLLDQGT